MNKVNSPLIGKNLNDLKELCEEHGAEQSLSGQSNYLIGYTLMILMVLMI